MAHDSSSFILASIALAGGDVMDAVLPTLAAAGAQVFASTEGRRNSICVISTVGLACEWLPQTVVNALRNARAPSTRFLFDSQWRLLAQR